ncbi:MAG: hypothetical protein LBU83_09320 [Bacteroidales bacterium]|jgi:hypothetical protein|nr:hypothetical protein [Bacteroidales bacterium]
MNKGILFFIGLLVGILICALIYYFDVNIPKIPKIIEKKEVVKHVDTVYIEKPLKPKKQNVDIIPEETVYSESIIDEQPEDEISEYETEFSIDAEVRDDVFSDRLLNTRVVKVKFLTQEKQEAKIPDDFFQSFEIQQWSTPIKNKITYNRNKNLVKIKGMEIDKVSVVLWSDTYFLEFGNRYYSISETINFEKLIPVQIPY